MVDIDTAIEELNTGICYLVSKDEDTDFCTTEGELVILLKRLREFDSLDLEADDIKYLLTLVKNKNLLDENKRLREHLEVLSSTKCL